MAEVQRVQSKTKEAASVASPVLDQDRVSRHTGTSGSPAASSTAVEKLGSQEDDNENVIAASAALVSHLRVLFELACTCDCMCVRAVVSGNFAKCFRIICVWFVSCV
jgi:hypothetical protein